MDGVKGDNTNPGTLASPWKEIIYAVAQSRGRPAGTTACIYMRAGQHWFGDHRENFGLPYESQIGSLSLTAIDSYLTLSSYNGEEVVFSGGVDLSSSLQWSQYKTVPAGTIMQAKLPASVDVAWEHFNELYIDGSAAIRAKYPNGDPFTTGRSTNPTGYMDGADKWIGPDKTIPPAVEIHVATPAPNSTYFPGFQIGLEGTVKDFDPPHSYWGLANPPVRTLSHSTLSSLIHRISVPTVILLLLSAVLIFLCVGRGGLYIRSAVGFCVE